MLRNSFVLPRHERCSSRCVMAAIDSLLKLAKSQGADELTVTADDVPCLFKNGDKKNLTMPAISQALAEAFALEIIGAERAGELDEGRALSGAYESDDGSIFQYEIGPQGDALRLRLRPVSKAACASDEDSCLSEEPLSPISTAVETTPCKVKAADASLDFSKIADASPACTPPLRAASAHDGSPVHPPARLLSSLELALDKGASDIFLSEGDYPRMRIKGEIEILDSVPVEESHILEMAGAALTEERRLRLERTGSLDFGISSAIQGGVRRFRVSLFTHCRGLAAALRPIRNRPLSLKELNLPEELREICAYPNGLVLVTGAAGAGKSSTLAALIDHINRNRACHIITLEDPIELEHADRRAMIHQRELGRHMDSFSGGLIAALRESPDVILLGEMRDLSTVSAALTAAETGHLVLSTLHTGDAVSAIDRIIDVFPGHRQSQIRRQLASVLRTVLTQVLVPSPSPPGRVPAVEKLVVTSGAACHIREGRNHQIAGLMQAGGAEGMITLERSLAGLVADKKVTLKTALGYAKDPEGLKKLAGTRRQPGF